MSKEIETDLLVLGGGPGGYTAAFRAADLGKKVLILDKAPQIGGVCLHAGCIPSKTLLHAAGIIEEAAEMKNFGVSFGKPKIDLKIMSEKRDQVIQTLAKGAAGLAKARNVTVMQGTGTFLDDRTVEVDSGEKIRFENCVIAAGSRPVELPFIPKDDDRIWDSTDALALKQVPERLLILGGGIIGLEMAAIYHALGSAVTVVEMLDQLIPSADADLVRPLMTVLKKKYEGIYLSTKVTSIQTEGKSLRAVLEGKKAPEFVDADVVLVSVGRRANGDMLNLEKAGIKADKQGVIQVDEFLRTDVRHIYAVGDITGAPMLAHRASYQGRTAAEVISGEPVSYAPMTVPSVAYTSPEVAWMGITEKEAVKQGISYRKGTVPWQANGRALSAGKKNGVTKALFDEKTGRIIGAGITGYNAGELLAEAVLALEMGSDAEDLALTMHAHPTLSETFMIAAEHVHGSVTDMLPEKSK